MSKSLQKLGQRRAVRRIADPCTYEVSAPSLKPVGGSFFSFTYSYAELSSQGGRTHVKATQTRLHEGKLTSEAFEGELGADVHEAAIREVQQRLFDHAAWLLHPLGWLPWWPPRSDRK